MTKQKFKILKETLEKHKMRDAVYSQVIDMALANGKSSLATGYTEYSEAWLKIVDFCSMQLEESKNELQKILDKIREDED